ncbi:hypothetical protein STEG23_036569 [Scotinomys teguina]
MNWITLCETVLVNICCCCCFCLGSESSSHDLEHAHLRALGSCSPNGSLSKPDKLCNIHDTVSSSSLGTGPFIRLLT